ncbi:MAG: OmpA family protein [Taibaiella sp.]|nr:OmpA family protein [Taibaiella sp.]
MKKIICTLYLLMIAFFSYSHRADSFNVYFPLNVRTLTPSAQQTIDSLIYEDLINTAQRLVILGYADYLAGADYNLQLSKDRAERVKEYLVRSGFKNDNIRYCIGKGKIERSHVNGKAGYAPDRKVQIAIDKEIPPVPPVKALRLPVAASHKVDITELKKNETLVLENIYFLPGRHTVREESLPEVDRLCKLLADHPAISVQIEGHICCQNDGHPDGFDYDNGDWGLSTYRAKAIYDFLIQRGIPANRLKYKGFGKSHPLVDPERTSEDENKNRRVEVRVL